MNFHLTFPIPIGIAIVHFYQISSFLALNESRMMYMQSNKIMTIIIIIIPIRGGVKKIIININNTTAATQQHGQIHMNIRQH